MGRGLSFRSTSTIMRKGCKMRQTLSAVLLLLALAAKALGQAPEVAAITNGASFQLAGLASNSWVSIFGTNLASSTRTWTTSDFVNGTLPTSLDGVSVSIQICYSYLPGYNSSNVPTPPSAAYWQCAYEPTYVEYISPTQLNVLVSHDAEVLAILSNTSYTEFVSITGARILVTTAQGSQLFGWNWPAQYGIPFAIPSNGAVVAGGSGPAVAGTYDPAFFVVGGNYVAARHSDGVLVGKPSLIPGVVSRPAQPGEIISLYGTGFGPTSPQLPGNLLVAEPAALAGCEEVSGAQTYNGQPYFNCPPIYLTTQWPPPAITTCDTQCALAEWGGAAWAGEVEPGLFQINAKVPNLPNGDSQIVAAVYTEVQPGIWSKPIPTQAGLLITIHQ